MQVTEPQIVVGFSRRRVEELTARLGMLCDVASFGISCWATNSKTMLVKCTDSQLQQPGNRHQRQAR
jgi:hypothetical protein